VAEPGAVVDVVRAETGTDEFLEEICLFVGALRRAEPGDRPWASRGVDLGQATCDEVQRLVPARLAEVRKDLRVVDEAPRLAAAVSVAATLSASAAPVSPVISTVVPSDIFRQRPFGV